MRKFAIMLGICLMLSGLRLWDNGLNMLCREYPDATVTFTALKSEASGFSGDGVVTDNGAHIFIECRADAAAGIRFSGRGIRGESLRIRGGRGDAERMLSIYRAEILSEEFIPTGNIYIFYAYSPYLPEGKNIGSGVCNLQIAVNADTGYVTAGTPLILNGF